MTQQGDVFLFQTANDGEIVAKDGLVVMSCTPETAVYLSLFGGNEDVVEWWGNKDEFDESRQYKSETQKLLKSLPVITSNLLRIEDAANKDLAWLLDKNIASSVVITVSMPGLNKIGIFIEIVINGEKTCVEFTEDWKKLVEEPIFKSYSCVISQNFILEDITPAIIMGSVLDINYDTARNAWLLACNAIGLYSFDRKTWKSFSPPPGRDMHSIAGSNGTWVVGTGPVSGGDIYRSVDLGLTWDLVLDTANIFTVYNIVENNGVWVAVLGNSIYWSNDDGNTWNVAVSASVKEWRSVATDGNGRWVVISASGWLAVSTDNALTWTNNWYAANNWLDIAYADGLWVVVGNGGIIATNTNGSSIWTERQAFGSVTVSPYSSIGKSSGAGWIAGGGNGEYQLSDDGITWGSIKYKGNSNLTFGFNGSCIMVGNEKDIASNIYEAVG